MRKWHRIKRNHSTRGPANFLFFDVETRPNPVQSARPTFAHVFRLGVASALRIEKGVITRKEVIEFTSKEEYWGFVESRLDRKRPLWIFAHNLSFDFRLVGGFRKLELENHHKWRLVIADPPTILRGKLLDRPVCFIDSLNYFRMSLAKLGAELGCPKMLMPPFDAPDSEWFAYCRNDVEILERSVLKLREYIYENDLGVMGKTVSQCAAHAFRHRFMSEHIVIHGNEEVAGLERQCYFGGQTECYRLGRIKGPVFELDVNSLYPSVMKDNLYPCSLAVKRGPMPIDEAKSFAGTYGGCARVWLYASDRSYPVRRWGKPQKIPGGWWRFPDDDINRSVLLPYYARGIFRTFLCGPELKWALDNGHVERIESVAWYHVADLFSGYVDFFYRQRLELAKAGKEQWAMMAKLLLNSLSGWFARKSPRWDTIEWHVPPVSWGPWFFYDGMEQCLVPARSIAGLSQLQTRTVDAPDSFTAISAFITSHGRERMRMLRQLAGEENVYYQDTDSLFIHEEGMARLSDAGMVNAYGLGQLKLKGTHEEITIHGIKDYETPIGRVLKGIGPDVAQEADGSYCKWKWDRMYNAILARGTEEVRVREHRIRPTREYMKGEILPDGRILPFTLWQRDDSRCPF